MSMMKHTQKCLHRAYVTVTGSFAPNGTNAVVAASNKGVGFSVARTSAGLFTLTFADKHYDLISFVAGLRLASADDKCLVGGVYVAASKTLTITVWDKSGAAATDIAVNANNRISFKCEFQYAG